MATRKDREKIVAVATDTDLFTDKSAALLEEESRKVKKTKDYTEEITAALATALNGDEKDESKLLGIIQQLLPWEKKARLASDMINAVRIAKTVLRLCFNLKKYDTLKEYFSYFVKSRAQMVSVIKTIVQFVLNIVLYGNEEGEKAAQQQNDDNMADDAAAPQYKLSFEEQLELLSTIITVAENRLCVEYEYSTAVVYQANLLLNKNAPNADGYKYTAVSKADLDKAYDLIVKIPAEVVGSMSYYEKATTLLNQIKIAILVENFMKALQLLKKIRVAELTKFPELKYYYHLLSAEIYYSKNDFLNCARNYQQLFLLTKPNENGNKLTDVVDVGKEYRQSAQDISPQYNKTYLSKLFFIDINQVFYPPQALPTELWKVWLQRSIISAILAPFDYEQEQVLQLFNLPQYEQFVLQIGVYQSLLKQFTSKQFIAWPVTQDTTSSQIVGDATNDNTDLKLFDALAQDAVLGFDNQTFSTETKQQDAVSMSDDMQAKKGNADADDLFNTKVNRYELLFKRIVHHNIQILSQNYSQIRLDHAVNVMNVEGLNVEYFEKELTSIADQVKCTIDRRERIVNFNSERGTGAAVVSKWADDLAELFKLVENTEQFIQKVRVVENAKKLAQ